MAEEKGPLGILPKGPIRKMLERERHTPVTYAEIFKQIVKYPFIVTIEDEFGKVIDWKDVKTVDEARDWRDMMLAKFPEAVVGHVQEITWKTRAELTRMKGR